MNWYRIAQLENMSQFKISKELARLKQLYLDFLEKERKEGLSPEEKKEMERVGMHLNSLGKKMNKSIEDNRESTSRLIQEGKEHEVTPVNFFDYHHTGDISNSAYSTLNDKKGLEWLGGIEKYPILVKKTRYGNEDIEFRQRGSLAPTIDETSGEHIPPYTDSNIMVAFNSQGEAIGNASDEFGADGVWVIKEYQGMGIGTDLLYEFRKQFSSSRRIGQMTSSGKSMTRSYHKKLVEEALRQGKAIPEEVLQYHELVYKE